MITTLFVFDQDCSWSQPQSAISFDTYLRDYPKLNEPRMRIINLCDTQRYLSQGYYCSLLAEARNHEVLPSIKVINALREDSVHVWVEHTDLSKDIESAQWDMPQVICMGEVADARFQKVATRVFQEFPAPQFSHK